MGLIERLRVLRGVTGCTLSEARVLALSIQEPYFWLVVLELRARRAIEDVLEKNPHARELFVSMLAEG